MSSRQTATGRPGSCPASTSRVPASRRGDSNATSVSAAPRNRLSSSPRARGRKPTKRHRSAGSPDATSAVVTAEGPGSTSTLTPAARQARTRAKPGSDTTGCPRIRHEGDHRSLADALDELPLRERLRCARAGSRAASGSRGGRAAHAYGGCPRTRSGPPPAASRARGGLCPRGCLSGSDTRQVAPPAPRWRSSRKYRVPRMPDVPEDQPAVHALPCAPPSDSRSRRAGGRARPYLLALRQGPRRASAADAAGGSGCGPSGCCSRCSASSLGWIALSLVLFLISSQVERTPIPTNVDSVLDHVRLPADLRHQHPRAGLRPPPEEQQGTGGGNDRAGTLGHDHADPHRRGTRGAPLDPPRHRRSKSPATACRRSTPRTSSAARPSRSP